MFVELIVNVDMISFPCRLSFVESDAVRFPILGFNEVGLGRAQRAFLVAMADYARIVATSRVNSGF